jgi:hypothetical protein
MADRSCFGYDTVVATPGLALGNDGNGQGLPVAPTGPSDR